MSILKRIVSKLAGDGAKASSLVDRPPRVQLYPLHRVLFRVDGRTETLEVANISSGGMAIFHRDHPSLKVGGNLKGTISIEKEEFAIEARVRHIIGVLAGCQFESAAAAGLSQDEHEKLRRAIENYFRLEVLALNLYPVSPEFLKSDPRGKSQWLTDGRQNEVFCITDEKGVLSFHLSFFGNYVEGARGEGLRVGSVHEKIASDRRTYKPSALLELSRGPSPETVRLALSFVQNAVRLPTEARKEIENFLGRELAALSAAQSG